MTAPPPAAIPHLTSGRSQIGTSLSFHLPHQSARRGDRFPVCVAGPGEQIQSTAAAPTMAKTVGWGS